MQQNQQKVLWVKLLYRKRWMDVISIKYAFNGYIGLSHQFFEG